MPHLPIDDFSEVMAEHREREAAVLDQLRVWKAKREAAGGDSGFAGKERDYDDLLRDADQTLSLMMVSCHRDTRLHLLEFVVESKKSTRPYKTKELDLILLYVTHNLREELPNNGLIEKAIKRLNDSFNGLLRQSKRTQASESSSSPSSTSFDEYEILSQEVRDHVGLYEIFIQRLHNVCINNIYHGAVMIRKKNSLRILLMMNTILNSHVNKWLWTKHKFAVLLDCIKWDNYDAIKSIAYEVVKSSNYINKYFQVMDNKFYIEMRKALTLANRRTPISVTGAAFMLRTLILADPIEIYFSEDDALEDLEVEEKNAYLVINRLKNTFEENVNLATRNIFQAITQSCLYGHIFCIRSILETINLRILNNCEVWKELISEIIDLCLELNEAVLPIVQNASPEGFMPIDVFEETVDVYDYKPIDRKKKRKEDKKKGFNSDDESETEYEITPRMLLLCSWRSIKDTSLFFGHLISEADIDDEEDDECLLSQDQASRMAENLFQLVRETKHRGAFEVCSVAFEKACKRFWQLPASHEQLSQMPKKWLQSVMLDILELSLVDDDREKLCATRRSAGVPFMIQAILTSEIRKGRDEKDLLFHDVMKLLLKIILIGNRVGLDDKKSIARGEPLFADCSLERLDEPFADAGQIRTHALFILRALYKHAKLGDLVKDYVELGFFAAFNSYTADNWGEQNAATILFSALMSRAFGVQLTKDHVNVNVKNKMTVDTFMLDFPNLILYMLRELSSASVEPSAKVQSLLLLVTRIYPKKYLPDTYIDQTLHKLFELVQRCAWNKSYQTRELAARAVVALMIPEDVAVVVPDLFKRIMGQPLSLNATHGYLLQLIEIFGCREFKIDRVDAQLTLDFIDFARERLMMSIDQQQYEHEAQQQPCYAICHACVKLLRKIYEAGSAKTREWLVGQTSYLDLVDMSTELLVNKIKPGPHIELFQAEVIRLALAPIEEPAYQLEVVKGRHEDAFAAKFWKQMLGHENAEVSELAWNHLMVLMKHNGRRLAAMAMGQTMRAILSTEHDRKVLSQVYQQASCIVRIYDALLNKWGFMDDSAEEMGVNVPFAGTFCQVVDLSQGNSKFKPSRGYFVLLEVFHRTIVQLNRRSLHDEDALLERKECIYRYFRENSEPDAPVEFRDIISKLMFDSVLYSELKPIYGNYTDISFHWWTTLLNLLFDEKPSIRENARNVVRRLAPWRDRFYCESLVLEQFFVAFCRKFMPEQPQLAASIMFIWTMKAVPSETTDNFEQDHQYTGENHEALEPLLISELCAARIREMKSLRKNCILTVEMKQLLMMELDFGTDDEFDTLKEYVSLWQLLKYEETPSEFGRMNHHVKPGCPSEHVRRVAFKNLRDALQFAGGWDLQEGAKEPSTPPLAYEDARSDDEFVLSSTEVSMEKKESDGDSDDDNDDDDYHDDDVDDDDLDASRLSDNNSMEDDGSYKDAVATHSDYDDEPMPGPSRDFTIKKRSSLTNEDDLSGNLDDVDDDDDEPMPGPSRDRSVGNESALTNEDDLSGNLDDDDDDYNDDDDDDDEQMPGPSLDGSIRNESSLINEDDLSGNNLDEDDDDENDRNSFIDIEQELLLGAEYDLEGLGESRSGLSGLSVPSGENSVEAGSPLTNEDASSRSSREASI
ncbi:uncharacterized protein LOC106657583 [Trichogramma pretiosum]|uniref:uncharacterized protein LOC106657583 n=1 Tax=Trichogramma pretiosum TaxID=7493 RepID=UPI0006C93E0C|nr:uncharacterized protein LOC106657583 [Trichogramma pretiosum]